MLKEHICIYTFVMCGFLNCSAEVFGRGVTKAAAALYDSGMCMGEVLRLWVRLPEKFSLNVKYCILVAATVTLVCGAVWGMRGMQNGFLLDETKTK